MKKNMQYREYQPNAVLSPCSEAYWTGDDFEGKDKRYKISSDGCVDIIITLDKTNQSIYSEIVGVMTAYLESSQQQTAQMFGIRFKPAGITAFSHIPVEEFTDKRIELSLIERFFENSFYESLYQKLSTEEIIKHIDNYLTHNLFPKYIPDKQIVRAIDLIDFSKGQLSPARVASDVCLCPRHFERKFKSAIGVSPKTYAKICRFKHTLHYLRNYPHQDLVSVAIACGYYDHTHLIRDFKTFSGKTPTALR
jgi:AraC-like DNA-binding protein